MASVNKVILLGNLGADPEVRVTQGGQCVANLSIATNKKWMNKNTGQPEERTEWHKVVVWGKQAENCRDYLSKGRTVYIEGELQTRKWEDKQGQARYTTEVVANTVQFVGGGGGSGRSQASQTSPTSQTSPADSGTDNVPSFDSDDDIPF